MNCKKKPHLHLIVFTYCSLLVVINRGQFYFNLAIPIWPVFKISDCYRGWPYSSLCAICDENMQMLSFLETYN